MGNNFPFATWVISLVLISAIFTDAEDVIHLDLAPLRMLSGEAAPRPTTSAFEEHVHILSENDTNIYCSDSTFPNDIFCDVESLKRVDPPELLPVTTNFYLKYRHPTRSQAVCFVSFENPDDSSPSRLVYKSFSCYDSPPGSPVQWLSMVEWRMEQGEVIPLPVISLPDDLKVRDMTALEMEDRGVENQSTKCKNRFEKAGAVPRVGGSVPPASVAFERGGDGYCVSSAPPPTYWTVPPFLPTEEVTPEA